jgi:hypothetical protein
MVNDKMPERIWMPAYDGKLFAFKGSELDTEYVLATTHARTVEALREAVKANGSLTQIVEIMTETMTAITRIVRDETMGKDEAVALLDSLLARAEKWAEQENALAKIKEAADGR